MSSLPRTSRASLVALRRSARTHPQSVRSLATHAAEAESKASSSSAAPPSASTSAAGSAASSSSSSSSSWTPTVKPGVVPAYDAALRFISSQSAQVRREMEGIKSSSSLDDARKNQVLQRLTVAAEVNDPAIRWTFTNTRDDDLDMSNPTIRHLRERGWRKCGSLDKLIERVRNQGVVPDSVGYITPTVDVQYIISDVGGPGVGDHAPADAQPSGDVLAGVLMEQKHLMEEPLVRMTAFHAEEKKYTLLMLDLDRPDIEGNAEHYLHWMVTDIPLSAGSPRMHTPTQKLGKEIVPYLPPFPAKGSERHRYVTLLLEQSADKSPEVSSYAATEQGTQNRESFALRGNGDLDVDGAEGFVELNSLKPVGIHFFRCEWTPTSEETISRIWRRAGLKEEAWAKINRKERKRQVPLSAKLKLDSDVFDSAVEDAHAAELADAEGTPRRAGGRRGCSTHEETGRRWT